MATNITGREVGNYAKVWREVGNYAKVSSNWWNVSEPYVSVHRATIAKFIPQVCKAICNCLKDEYLKLPSSAEEWEIIADKTFDSWQFPDAFATVYGKDIALFYPNASGSEFYNHKGL